MELITSRPHWWQDPLPGNVPYTALVLSREYVPVRVEGEGDLIDWSGYKARDEELQIMKTNGTALRLMPGKTRTYFEKREGS